VCDFSAILPKFIFKCLQLLLAAVGLTHVGMSYHLIVLGPVNCCLQLYFIVWFCLC